MLTLKLKLQDQETRLAYFKNTVLPPIMRSEQDHTLIVARTYFDFVRLRNLLRKAEASYATISEYSTQKNIARSRQYFARGQRSILLVTERWYFFRRLTIKNIHHIVLYSLPEYATFYAEWLNGLPVSSEVATSVLTLYTRYDRIQLERIVGTTRAHHMLTAPSAVHLLY